MTCEGAAPPSTPLGASRALLSALTPGKDANMTRYNRFPVSMAFRLEDEVAKKVRATADAYGLPPAEWARKVVTEAVQKEFVRRPIRLRVLHGELLREYLGQLGRVGNNLNQVARSLNAGDRSANAVIEQELRALRQQYEVLVSSILDALGANTTP